MRDPSRPWTCQHIFAARIVKKSMRASGRKSEGKEAQGERISGKLLAAEGAIEERISRGKNVATFQDTAGELWVSTILSNCHYPSTWVSKILRRLAEMASLIGSGRMQQDLEVKDDLKSAKWH